MQIGSYTTTPIEKRPWNRISTNIDGSLTQLQKQKKVKGQKKIVNPIFWDIAQLLSDFLWKPLFTECAYGKFPRGFSFKDNTLFYKNKRKIDSLVLPAVPQEALTVSMQFFRDRKGLIEDDDEEDEDRPNVVYSKWSEIKKKRTRETFIASFLCLLKEKYHLSSLEFVHLKTTVLIGFTLGYCNRFNIRLEHGQISSIGGLLFDEKNRKFYFDSHIKKPNKGSTKSKKKSDRSLYSYYRKKEINFLSHWSKYVNGNRVSPEATTPEYETDADTEAQSDRTERTEV